MRYDDKLPWLYKWLERNPMADYLPAPNLVMCMNCGNAVNTLACICKHPLPWGAPHRDGVSEDIVNHPTHYGGDTTYETIKVIEVWNLNFNLGNAVKYISRVDKKSLNSIEDIRKAIWYLQRELQRRGEVKS